MADSKVLVSEEVTLQDVYQEYAKTATDEKPALISLVDKFSVKFTKEFRDIKVGTVFKNISQVAFDLYTQNGVATQLK